MIQIKKVSVLISVTNEHWIHKSVVHRLLKLQMDGRYNITIIMPSHKPYENNLHHIVKDVVNGGFDFWLNIDSDNPPERNPLDLVELDLDVVGMVTPVIHFDKLRLGDAPVYLNAYDYVPEHDAYKPHIPFKGLQEVDAIGTGCVLFSAEVFKHPEMMKGCFTRKLNSDGTVNKGNDISFCERAKENGFRIYAHYDYFCGHFKEIETNEMVEHFKAFNNDKQEVYING
jgi:hypothetical protein